MIISQTPLRISLAGGGTDFEEFYQKEGGAVLSSAIDKYVYVIVKERFDDKIYINYSRKEIVGSIDEIEHDLVREAMRKTGVASGVEITTLADVPSEGSGLGSSSSITVGLLNALYGYEGEMVTAERLAREACEIEIDILGRPIGKQDQYIAAYGNLRIFRFQQDGNVTAEKISLSEEKRRRLGSNLLLFFTNRTRQSSSILAEQKHNIGSNSAILKRLRDLVFEAKDYLLNDNLDCIGEILHSGWEEKKGLASAISDSTIDRWYERARDAGALGGKISGAGGGGFLLLYCPRDRQDKLRQVLQGLRELPFHLERGGSRVIFNISNYDWK